MWRWAAAVTTAGAVLLSGAAPSQETVDVQIDLGPSEREVRMAGELRALLEKYDLEPWILTRRVRIEQRVIPHSHPVLTLHTRSLGDEVNLLATFLHEQIHWLEEMRPETWEAAMADFRELYPEVPGSSEGGARDDESTYRHLLVCDLEFQALTTLVGEDKARETLAAQTHYEWIYDRVLHDPRIREVALKHGFDGRQGVVGAR